jgi:hypothetical protein
MVLISSCQHFRDPIYGSWGDIDGDEIIFREGRTFEWKHVGGAREEGNFYLDYKFPFHLQLQTSQRTRHYRLMFVRGSSFNKIRIMEFVDNNPEPMNWDQSKLFERIVDPKGF